MGANGDLTGWKAAFGQHWLPSAHRLGNSSEVYRAARLSCQAGGRNRHSQLPQVVHPVVRLEARQLFKSAVSVTHGAHLHTRAAAGFHVGRAVTDEQAIFRFGAECVERGEDYVRGGLAGETVGALYVVEMREQAELIEYRARGDAAFCGGGGFAAA